MRVTCKGFCVGAVLFAATVGMGQDEDKGGLSHASKKPNIDAAGGPVTLTELYATIDRVEVGVRKVVLSAPGAAKAHPPSVDRAANRSEIIQEFYRLFLLAKPHFKFTPKASKFDPKLITIPAADPVRKSLETMIRFGFIWKVAPIATSPTSTMAIPEYGDALGFFMARMGDLTHTPSSQWSPYLFNHKDN